MSLSFLRMQDAVNLVIKSGHVPNIVGLQGIGKSDLVADLAKKEGYLLNTITCSQLQEGDMAMPYLCDGDVKYAINTIITNFEKKCDAAGKDGIIFLDEFNRPRSPQVQSELMNLVLQRRIVTHDVSNRIKLILAMNPSSEMEGYEDTDYSVSFSDSAILGRVVSLNMEPSYSDWVQYASKIKDGRRVINDAITSFLGRNKTLFVTKERSGNINNTPRGWSRASDILYTWESEGIPESYWLLRECLMGTLEKRTVDLFISYYKSMAKSTNYSLVAKNIMEAGNINIELKKLENFNAVQLDNVFNAIIDYVYTAGNVSDAGEANMVDFLLSVPKEVLYAWVSVLQKDHEFIYDALVMDSEKFANTIMNILDNVIIEKKGGFSGK